MSVLYTNNATTTLSASITNSTTSLSVASGTGSLFPAITGSDFFFVTISNSAGTNEIVKVTARSVDTFTIVRAQDGTSAAAWSAGDKVELRVTKGLLDQLKIDAVNGYASASSLSSHTGNTSNPHSVTATQVGLGNVTNESKATMFTSPTFTGTVSGVTASMVGLGNVENKSSATIRGEITNSNVTTALGYTPYNSTNPSGYITGITSGNVTTALGFTPLSTTGTAADSDKLDGQHGSYYQPASTAITTSNIGSQSVNYATSAGSAGNADTLDGNHASAFQSTLVSGTNIKTVGGNSLLGSGDISVGGGATQARFTSNGSFTVPAGITTIYVTAVAGGGGGGGTSNDTVQYYRGGGAGGGAGGCANYPLSVSPGQVIAITIGGGGSGSVLDGQSGGSTSIGSLLTLTGGGGGKHSLNGGTSGAGGVGPQGNGGGPGAINGGFGCAGGGNGGLGHFCGSYGGAYGNDTSGGNGGFAGGGGGGCRRGANGNLLSGGSGMGGIVFIGW